MDLGKDVKYVKGVGPNRAELLNKLGICFHYQRRVRQFMLNQIDNAFDYFEDFNNSEYRIYLGAVLYKTEKDIGAYYTGGLNNPKYLESLIKTLNVVRNKLNEEKEFTR